MQYPGAAMTDQHVVFYANGPARLLMACVIGDEMFPDARKSIIMLHQYGYNYDKLLPYVQDRFEQVFVVRERAKRYSHLDQFRNTYFNRYRALDAALRPGSTLVQFGLRSPIQKHLSRRANRLGARVEIYAEGVAVERYFRSYEGDGLVRGTFRRMFPRAFDHQHDYDVFYMLNPDVYANSPHRPKLAAMFDLYGSDSFHRYAAILTKDIDLSEVEGYDTVLLGQPLGQMEGQDNVRAQEERMLLEIIGDRRVLVLPHPIERTQGGLDKYRVLPGAKVLSTGVPSELLLLGLRPSVTITYASNAAINYAIMNHNSTNYFYPVYRSRYDILLKHQQSLPNMIVNGDYAQHDYPGD